MRRLFGTKGALPNYPAWFNIAPTQAAPVVRIDEAGSRQLVLLRWGLVPSWSKGLDSRYSMINARAEAVATKTGLSRPVSRAALPRAGGRVLRMEGGAKQPYRFTLRDGGLFAFAGLWVRWQDPAGAPVESFTIIVTTPNALVRKVHDRMPVILDATGRDRWLDPKTEPAELNGMLEPFPAEAMTATRVSRRMNSPANDDPACIEPAE